MSNEDLPEVKENESAKIVLSNEREVVSKDITEKKVTEIIPVKSEGVMWTEPNITSIFFKKKGENRAKYFLFNKKNNTIDWGKWLIENGASNKDYNQLDIKLLNEDAALEFHSYFPHLKKRKIIDKRELNQSIHDGKEFTTTLNFIMGGRYILRINSEHKFFSGYKISGLDLESGANQKINSHDLLNKCDPLIKRFKHALDKTKGRFLSGDILSNGSVYIVSDNGLSIFNTSKTNTQEIEEQPVFYEKIIGDDNLHVFQDSNQENKVFFCNSVTVDTIKSINLEDSKEKQVKEHKLPKRFKQIDNLYFDPSGKFLFVVSYGELTIIHWNTKKIVKIFPNMNEVVFGPDGKLYYEEPVGDKSRILSVDINLDEVDGQYQKLWLKNLKKAIASGAQGQLAENIAVTMIGENSLKDLEPAKEIINDQNLPAISSLATIQGLKEYSAVLSNQRELLLSKYNNNQTAFLMRDVETSFLEKEKEIIASTFEILIANLQKKVIEESDVPYEILISFSRDLEEVHSRRSLLSQEQRLSLSKIRQQLKKIINEYFLEKKDELEAALQNRFENAMTDIKQLTSMDMLLDWKSFDLPLIREHFYAVMRDIPPDQTDLIEVVGKYLEKLRSKLTSAEEEFTAEVNKSKVKQESSQQALVDQFRLDIDDFLETLLREDISDIYDLQRRLINNPVLNSLYNQITDLALNWPSLETTLTEYLNQGIDRVINQATRMLQTELIDGGQYVMFGTIPFPIFEKEKTRLNPIEVKLSFIANKTGQRDALGDVGFSIRKSNGDTEQTLLFESRLDRDNWRYGIYSYRGESIPPTVMSVEEFRELYRNYIDWSQGDKSNIQQENTERRQALRNLYNKRKKIGERGETDSWDKKDYKRLLKEYGEFVKKHQIVLLRQIEKGIIDIQNGEEGNGYGHIPEWKSHWVSDENQLAEMAENFKMQLDLNTGMLLLVGHTGTGKDVLLNMFCERTQRPKFDFDCSKWTTEFELSEDVVLQDGGVVPIPSKVLKAIQTPGSVLYFNEYNAMPESAQIFTHALLDEKRSLTLKTRSGKVVKVAKGVLIAGSMNANYPGTFKPQFATRGRMVTQRLEYPSLMTEKDVEGTVQEVFNGSEAMRIAREVTSLRMLTYGAVAEDTAFMQLWDQEINRITKELVFKPTPEQIFDLSVIAAIVQFTAQLRELFVATIEKSRRRNDLKVEQPVSGRDLRKCAYALRQIPSQQKIDGSIMPEKVARDLLKRFFVEHIDDRKQRDDIVTAMTNWTVTKKKLPE